jgi:hypothetical protein
MSWYHTFDIASVTKPNVYRVIVSGSDHSITPTKTKGEMSSHYTKYRFGDTNSHIHRVIVSGSDHSTTPAKPIGEMPSHHTCIASVSVVYSGSYHSTTSPKTKGEMSSHSTIS